jgi:D-ribose pyranose/furanose isomerase RbsD
VVGSEFERSNVLSKFGLRSTQSSSDGQKNHLEIFDTTEEMPLWNIIHEIDMALSNKQLVSNSSVLQVQLDSANKEAAIVKEHLTEKIEMITNLHKKEQEASKEVFAMLKENYNDLKNKVVRQKLKIEKLKQL